MSLYDDIKPETLKQDLRHFAELILRLDADDQLLDATPRILKMLGDLRAKIFAYEVRSTGRLAPGPRSSDALDEIRRILDDAIQREAEARAEWTRPWSPETEQE